MKLLIVQYLVESCCDGEFILKLFATLLRDLIIWCEQRVSFVIWMPISRHSRVETELDSFENTRAFKKEKVSKPAAPLGFLPSL
jgi:hypothetical protein